MSFKIESSENKKLESNLVYYSVHHAYQTFLMLVIAVYIVFWVRLKVHTYLEASMARAFSANRNSRITIIRTCTLILSTICFTSQPACLCMSLSLSLSLCVCVCLHTCVCVHQIVWYRIRVTISAW